MSAATNPLICSDGWNSDTAHGIRCALEFMGDAIAAIGTGSGLSGDTAHGASLLLFACAHAIELTEGAKQ